ncbi:hypothetical protein OCS65_07690 [Rhodococcus aetherivorans]|uniref:Uncharacterized protein n=1 Tax=Rhodococcus aetherivorans TaxID=191292 RepID=A0AA46SF50_9NOCA|nr:MULTISPECIES: hypothetical protein [Rhodococcus]UYF95629.1 hypothetical protein OCS65_07690 [Rhodococcus aetherivorans]
MKSAVDQSDRMHTTADSTRDVPARHGPYLVGDRSGNTRRSWRKAYGRRPFWTGNVVLAIVLARVVHFGEADLLAATPFTKLNYAVVSVCLAAAWTATLVLFHTRSRRVVSSGYEELQRMISGTLRHFGAIATVSLVSGARIAIRIARHSFERYCFSEAMPRNHLVWSAISGEKRPSAI